MISIITITYNRKTFLEKAVESVQNQSYKDFEHVIVDDGSTDGTREFIEQLNGSHIRYFYSEKIGRLSALRNIGLDMAKGEICVFLDSDDFWENNYLETIKPVFDKENVLSVISNAYLFNSESKEALFGNNSGFQTKGNLLKQKLLNDKFVICQGAFAFKNQKNFRPNTSLKYGDNDLFLKIISEGNSIILYEKLVYIRKHESNMSSEKSYHSSFIQAYFEEFVSLDYLKKHNRISNFLYRRSYSNYAYKLAKNLLILNRKKESEIYFLKAFFMFPFNYKALAKFVVLLFS